MTLYDPLYQNIYILIIVSYCVINTYIYSVTILRHIKNQNVSDIQSKASTNFLFYTFIHIIYLLNLLIYLVFCIYIANFSI